MELLWWHWVVIGLVLILLEMAASGGFYVIFFGVAALAIGSLNLLGVADALWQQLLLFSVISVGSLILFRNSLIRRLKLDAGSADVDSLVGEVGVTMDDLPAGGVGRIELRGTVWSARNATAAAIPRGTRSIVTRVDRLMLLIRPEESGG